MHAGTRLRTARWFLRSFFSASYNDSRLAESARTKHARICSTEESQIYLSLLCTILQKRIKMKKNFCAQANSGVLFTSLFCIVIYPSKNSRATKDSQNKTTKYKIVCQKFNEYLTVTFLAHRIIEMWTETVALGFRYTSFIKTVNLIRVVRHTRDMI